MTVNKSSMRRDSSKMDEAPDLSSPEWTAKFQRAEIVRGRPKLAQPKISTTIRFDADVLQHFRAEGRGWQTRVNAILRDAMSGRFMSNPAAQKQPKQKSRG